MTADDPSERARPTLPVRPIVATPRDVESSLPLVRIEPGSQAAPPVLNPPEDSSLNAFLREHREANRLARAGLAPSWSLLLIGPPGVGKTMTARYIATSLELPLVVLDLVTVMSSYLGQTGQNLQRALDYARLSPCVMLLDEFDAIAKHRGDNADIGELKRVVNVLLLELERQPTESIVVAATNHPELLDRAIQRRFERVITLDLPTPATRRSILLGALVIAGAPLDDDVLDACVTSTAGYSGSDLVRLGRLALRRSVLDGEPLDVALSAELGGAQPKEEP